MRNPLGLMLASVVAAVVIAGVWFWTSSPRADAAPQTVAARKAEPLPAPAAKTAARDDIEVTAALSKPAPPVPAPAPAKSTCANPDALGVSRTVVREALKLLAVAENILKPCSTQFSYNLCNVQNTSQWNHRVREVFKNKTVAN